MTKNSFNLRGVDAGTIVRAAVLALALINQILTAIGKPVLPIEDAGICAVISCAITAAASIAAWWKNNSLTLHAQAADRYRQALKAGDDDGGSRK